MKTRNKIILSLAGLGVVISIFSIIQTVTHVEPEMTLEEFQERFDNDLTQHFKSKYQAGAGWGKSPGMIMPAWGFVAANDSNIVELRVKLNFGKHAFTYTCSELRTGHLYVKIKNPSIEDIDANPCWKT